MSIATVSRALNGYPSVDPELAERVKLAAARLSYRPNAAARNLRRRATAVWSLVIPDVENPFFTAIARGAEDVALRNGYSLILCNSDDDPGKEQDYLLVAAAERSAGVILAPTSPDTDVSHLVRHDIPIVTVDRRLRSFKTDSVVVNSRSAAAQAVRHLVDGGWHRIACITGPPGVSTADERLKGWRTSLKEAGRPHDDSLVARGDFRAEGGYQATQHLLAATSPPDALFAANNLMGLGAVEALQEAGRTLGKDFGLVVFDDLPWAQLIKPSISGVSQPTYDIGRLAANMLLDRLATPGVPIRRRSVTANLIVRESSTRPR